MFVFYLCFSCGVALHLPGRSLSATDLPLTEQLLAILTNVRVMTGYAVEGLTILTEFVAAGSSATIVTALAIVNKLFYLRQTNTSFVLQLSFACAEALLHNLRLVVTTLPYCGEFVCSVPQLCKELIGLFAVLTAMLRPNFRADMFSATGFGFKAVTLRLEIIDLYSNIIGPRHSLVSPKISIESMLRKVQMPAMETLFSEVLSSPSHVYATLELISACLSPLSYLPAELESRPEEWRQKLMVSAIIPSMGRLSGMLKQLLQSASESVLIALRSALVQMASLSPVLADQVLSLLIMPITVQVRAVLNAGHNADDMGLELGLARMLFCLAALAQQPSCRSVLLRDSELVSASDGPALLMSLCDVGLLPEPCASVALEVLYALVQVVTSTLEISEIGVISVVVHQLLGCFLHPDCSVRTHINALRVLTALAQFVPSGMLLVINEMLELESRPWAAITAPELLQMESSTSTGGKEEEETRLRELVFFLQLLALYPSARSEAPNKSQFMDANAALNWNQKLDRLTTLAPLEPLQPRLEVYAELRESAGDLQQVLDVLSGKDPRELG